MLTLYFLMDTGDEVEVIDPPSLSMEYSNNLSLHNLLPQSRQLKITLPLRVGLMTGYCEITLSDDTGVTGRWKGDVTHVSIGHGKTIIFMDEVEEF